MQFVYIHSHLFCYWCSSVGNKLLYGSFGFSHIFGYSKKMELKGVKIMKMLNKKLFQFNGAIAALALIIAKVSVSSTCFYLAYQPDVPDDLL